MGTTLGTLSNLAIYIGLVVLGAFLGSRKALRSRPLVDESAALAGAAVTPELATDPVFMEQYVEQMMF